MTKLNQMSYIPLNVTMLRDLFHGHGNMNNEILFFFYQLNGTSLYIL